VPVFKHLSLENWDTESARTLWHDKEMCIGKSWHLQKVPFHHIDPPSMVNSKRARARKDTRSRDKVRKTRSTVATWGSRHGLQKRTSEGHTSLEYMPQTESLIYFSMSMHPCFTYSCGNVCQSWPHKLDHSWKSTTKKQTPNQNLEFCHFTMASVLC
jgi:hypothetical protein